MEGAVDLIKKLYNEVEINNGFCYLGDKVVVAVKLQSQQE